MNRKERVLALDSILSDEKKRVKYLELMKILHADVGFSVYCRLILGDLKDIGDAIVEGKHILHRGHLLAIKEAQFKGDASSYKVKEKSHFYICDVRYDDIHPVSEVKRGYTYYIVDLTKENLVKVIWGAEHGDYTHLLANKLIHDSHASAINHAKALLSLNKGYSNE